MIRSYTVCTEEGKRVVGGDGESAFRCRHIAEMRFDDSTTRV